MTIDTDCTEPAPSAPDIAEQIAYIEQLNYKAVDYMQSDTCKVTAAILRSLRELASARSRIAELEKQCETLSRMHKQMCELAIERFERIAELEAGVRKWASECGECDGKGFIRAVVTIHRDGHVDRPCEACADIRALLPKESGPEREECEK